MAKNFKSRFFSHYQGVYKDSSEFPAGISEHIPESLITAIDHGNANFFKEIKDSLPMFYRTLVEKCSPVYLLERVYETETLAGEKKQHKLYCWALECDKTAVVMRIPVSDPTELEKKLSQPYFDALPVALHGCYAKADGMAIPDPDFAGTDGFDLPPSFNDWRKLEGYVSDLEIPKKKIAKIQKDMKLDDLRVYIRGSRKDLLMLNFTRKDKKLYYVHDHDFDNYASIKDVPGVLDDYFANAVLGFPETVDLRRKD